LAACGSGGLNAATVPASTASTGRSVGRGLGCGGFYGRSAVAFWPTAVSPGLVRGAGESLDGDVCGRRSLLGGIVLHLSAYPFRMLRVKTQPTAGWRRRHFGDTTFLKATLGKSGWRRQPSTWCSIFLSSFLLNFLVVACVGAACVEDPIRPGRMCRCSGRRPNPTGQRELGPGSMSQSDLGCGDEPCIWRLFVCAGGASEISAVARRR